MPEDLLLELETAPPVAGSLARVEDLGREAMRHAAQVALAVDGMKGSALTFENIWRRIVLDGLSETRTRPVTRDVRSSFRAGSSRRTRGYNRATRSMPPHGRLPCR